jgi:hypothetical protein
MGAVDIRNSLNQGRTATCRDFACGAREIGGRASKRMGNSAYVSVVIVPTPRAVSAALWRAPEPDRLIAPRIALLLHVIERGLEIAELSLGQLGLHPQLGHCGHVFPCCAVRRRIALAPLLYKDAVQLDGLDEPSSEIVAHG